LKLMLVRSFSTTSSGVLRATACGGRPRPPNPDGGGARIATLPGVRPHRPAAALPTTTTTRVAVGSWQAAAGCCPTSTDPEFVPKGQGHRLLHRPADGDVGDLCRRARPGDPPQLPARPWLDP
jgi:hypothetical protein